MAKARVPYDEAIIKQRKDFSDPNYEIRHAMTEKKPPCFVPSWGRPDSADGEKKEKP